MLERTSLAVVPHEDANSICRYPHGIDTHFQKIGLKKMDAADPAGVNHMQIVEDWKRLT